MDPHVHEFSRYPHLWLQLSQQRWETRGGFLWRDHTLEGTCQERTVPRMMSRGRRGDEVAWCDGYMMPRLQSMEYRKGGRAWQPLRGNGSWRRGRPPWRPTIRRGSL